MCGIARLIDFRRETTDAEIQSLAIRMAHTLRHGGPDDAGVWVDTAAGIALGHGRLAILDLSPTGHQPMESSSGPFVIVFNGEIYNFQELHVEMEESCSFRGHSDTEVMLACVER